jgi:hypothetical protein
LSLNLRGLPSTKGEKLVARLLLQGCVTNGVVAIEGEHMRCQANRHRQSNRTVLAVLPPASAPPHTSSPVKVGIAVRPQRVVSEPTPGAASKGPASMRVSSSSRRHAWAAPLSILVTLAIPVLMETHAQAQSCTEVSHTFTETFDDTVYYDADQSGCDGWGQGEVTLKAKGNSFDGDPASVGKRLYVAAPGDFDKDGWTDMIGLMLDPNCHLHFLKNMRMSGSPPEHQGFDLGTSAYSIDTPPGCSTESPVLLSGDIDADGDTDLLYMRITNENSAGTLQYAYIYENTGVFGGIPQFNRHDILGDLNGDHLSWHWTSTVAYLVDWDGDGRSDLVVASSHGTVNELLLYKAKSTGGFGFQSKLTLIPDLGMHTPIASSSQNASGNSSCPPAVSRGVNALMVGDFDADNDYDIIVGSTSEKDLKYWINDGNDSFTRQGDILFPEGAATLGLVGDFDGDGDQDIAVGRDGLNCNGKGGTVWFFSNNGSGTFTRRTTPIASSGDDLDFGFSAQLDNDSDGRLDIIAADGNHSGTYLRILSSKLKIYNLQGKAVSKIIDSLDNESNAITSVQMTGLDAVNVNPPATDITYYVSNDDGQHWEELLPNELPPTSDIHSFARHGADFRWKAEFSAEEQTLAADELLFAPATKTTPRLRTIRFTYYSVERRRYTRSGLSYGTVSVGSETHEVLYSASYYYPGYEATVTAFDITDLAAGATTGLERVDNHGDVLTRWDAGSMLASRSAASRTIYGAYAADGDGDGRMNDRLDLTVSEVETPSTSPTLQSMLILNDTAKSAVVRFIRGRKGDDTAERPAKFFDVGHSTPVFVGSPASDADYYGNGYAAFRTANAARTPLVLIGANDGMLHAFDAVTGAERWAIVPNNLLAKLKRQRQTDAAGNEVYNHDWFVDGKVTIQDVFDGAQWRTIAFVGQARGQGRQDRNYYFAVDITAPDNPRPLWEFTDTGDSFSTCTGEPCRSVCEEVCTPQPCTNLCTDPNHTFEESGGRVAMEAEHYNASSSIVGNHAWVQGTSTSGYSGSAYMAAEPDSGTNCSGNITNCGAQMRYHLKINDPGWYHVFFRTSASSGSDDSLAWGVNGTLTHESAVRRGTWRWTESSTAGASLSGTRRYHFPSAGEYDFTLWMREDGVRVDKILLNKSGVRPPDSEDGPAEACQATCPPEVCTTTCTTQCIAAGDEWPECGVGAGQQCCGDPGTAYCAPLGACAPNEPRSLGETWSPPVIGRVRIGGAPTFVAFFGSGYNNRTISKVGRSIYAVHAVTGDLLGRWDIDDLASGSTNPSTIDNTLPGGANLVDIDGDGYVDRLYIGDLEGRLWRLDISANATTSGTPPLVDNWGLTNIFDAAKEDAGSDRTWAPIVTKPAIAVVGRTPHVYFGTGGDDRAPGTIAYRFFAVNDNGSSTVRYLSDLNITNLEWSIPGTVGHKFWSDPTIANDSVVYFASLPGAIETVNPCLSLGDNSEVYGYAIRSFVDADGSAHEVGKSVLSADFLPASSKIRQALVVRSVQSGTWVTPSLSGKRPKSDVFIQEFSGPNPTEQPPIKRISEAGVGSPTKRVIIMRWREIQL